MWASQIVFSAWLLLFALHADAFGIIGHQLIADLASNFLTANASSQIESILDGRPLSSIAAWADSIKWMPQYRFTSKLHYINFEDDNPPAQCRFHWQAPGSQEVIAAIHNYTDLLMHAEEGSWSQSESLRFLTHYLEDSHQPLHLSGRARGGNDIMVRFDGYRLNLHRVWDSVGLLKRMRSVASQIEGRTKARHAIPFQFPWTVSRNDSPEELSRKYQGYLLELLESDRYKKEVSQWLVCPQSTQNPEFGCPEYWSREVSELNCKYVWRDVQANEALSAEYWRRIEDDMVFETLVMKASIRLASVLNAVFEHRSVQM